MGLEDLIFSFSGPLPLSRADRRVGREIFARDESGRAESELETSSLCLPAGSVRAETEGLTQIPKGQHAAGGLFRSTTTRLTSRRCGTWRGAATGGFYEPSFVCV